MKFFKSIHFNIFFLFSFLFSSTSNSTGLEFSLDPTRIDCSLLYHSATLEFSTDKQIEISIRTLSKKVVPTTKRLSEEEISNFLEINQGNLYDQLCFIHDQTPEKIEHSQHKSTRHPIILDNEAISHAVGHEGLGELAFSPSIESEALREFQYSIRRATLEDVETLAKVHIQAWCESYPDILDNNFLMHSKSDPKFYQKRIDEHAAFLVKGGVCFVLTKGNDIVGFCKVGPAREDVYANISGSRGEVYTLYLLDSVKGKGLGSKLWKRAVQYFEHNNLTPFKVWTLEQNKTARQFYEHKGGKLDGTKIIDIGGKFYKEVCYYYGYDDPPIVN